MKLSTINKLCCPLDKSDLKLHVIEQTLDSDIRLGSLSCKTCNRFYPIISGIPIMSPDEYRDLTLENKYYQNLNLLTNSQRIVDFKVVETV